MTALQQRMLFETLLVSNGVWHSCRSGAMRSIEPGSSRFRVRVSDAPLWPLAHPDLVDVPAVRAVIDSVTACASEDRAAAGV